MKRFVFFLIIISITYSCKKNFEYRDLPPTDTRLNIALLDYEGNDRLNPKSPSYFGEEFVKGIEVLSLGERVGIGRQNVLYPPYLENDLWGGQYSLYFIQLSWGTPIIEDEHKIAYSYVYYPDGNEDEMKMKFTGNEKGEIVSIDKIWINGVLVFDNISWDAGGPYYNSKFYHWLTPVYDNKKQIGFSPLQVEAGGNGVIVLIK